MSPTISMTWPQYQRGSCTHDGLEVYLSPYEAELLSVLLIRRGCPVTREELWELLWPDPDFAPELKIIDVYACKLRRKVPGVVETVWGSGYIVPRPGDPPLRGANPSDALGIAA